MIFINRNLFGHMEIGIAIYRFVIGIAMMCHGIAKFQGGDETLIAVGSAMATFGFDTNFYMWGLMSALVELVGGFLVTIGLFTRLAALAVVGNMIVATVVMFDSDSLQWLYPVEVGVGFLMLFIAGSGRWSVDSLISRR